MKLSWQTAVLRFAACSAILFAIVFSYKRLLSANPTTVALTFLLAVLGVSAVWPLRYSVFTALAATTCFNFFFLPPYGTFTIADPQNWVALFALLTTAVVASHLAERARRHADVANQRRREAERLYTFSQKLLLAENLKELLNAVPAHIVETFGVRAAAVFIATRPDVYRSNPEIAGLAADQLKVVSARGEAIVDSERGVTLMPVRLGVQPVGSIGVSGGRISLETLEAVGSLVAIAIERVGTVEKLSKAEAAREGERLRSALLDSVAHDFRTPLTSIKASVTSLLSDPNLGEEDRHELLTVIDEESDRLNHLVGEATEMALLDASQVELRLERQSIRAPLKAALEESRQLLKGRRVDTRFPSDLPPVRMDVARIKEVLLQLLENAVKYSPLGSPLSITAEAKGNCVVTSVADRGQGIDEFEQAMIFEKFYRGRQQRGVSQGTGLGLAIARAIVEAHGGTLGVTSQLGQGSVFFFTLPVAAFR